jgi:hypothetical protein
MSQQPQTDGAGGARRLVREIDPKTVAGAPPLPRPSAADLDQREALHDQRRQAEGAAAADTANAAPAPAEPTGTEAVDTVEIRLPDGRVVMLGQPKVPAFFTLGPMLRGDPDSDMWMSVGKVLLYVRAVDGVAVKPLASRMDLMQLSIDLGDVALDWITAGWQRFWSPPKPEDLPVLKKNLRGS